MEFTYGPYECEEGTKIRIKCWDTSGEGKYKGMVCYHLKEADIVIILDDSSDSISRLTFMLRLAEESRMGSSP